MNRENIGIIIKSAVFSFSLVLSFLLIFYKLTREVIERETLNFDLQISKLVYGLRTIPFNKFLFL